MSKEQEYIQDKKLSDSVMKTKVAHGKIETAVRVREAKTKKELDLELRRLNVLNRIDKSTIGEKLVLPREIKAWQELVLIIGTLSLKSSKEVMLAGKKLGYSGKLDSRIIKNTLVTAQKRYFIFDEQNGWRLTNQGQNEFARLKQFI
jgi:hypothetical protein